MYSQRSVEISPSCFTPSRGQVVESDFKSLQIRHADDSRDVVIVKVLLQETDVLNPHAARREVRQSFGVAPGVEFQTSAKSNHPLGDSSFEFVGVGLIRSITGELRLSFPVIRWRGFGVGGLAVSRYVVQGVAGF